MKEHCVAATQNWVGQLHWKIDGHVWHSAHGKKGHIHPEERKYGSESLRYLRVTNKRKWNSSTKIKQKQVKVKRGRKSLKLKDTVRSSTVSLSEKIPIKQIKDS